MIKQGIITLTCDIAYDPKHFDPESQLQLCWHDSKTNELIYEDPAYFSAEPVSAEKIKTLSNVDKDLPVAEKWKLQLRVAYEDSAVDLYADNLGIYEFNQEEACVVSDSKIMRILKIELHDFQLKSSAPSKKRSKPTGSNSRDSAELEISTGKFIVLATTLLIFSLIGAAVSTVMSIIYLDPINAVLEMINVSLTTTAVGKYIPVFFAFGIGSYLGPIFGSKLLQKWGFATNNQIRRVFRMFRKHR